MRLIFPCVCSNTHLYSSTKSVFNLVGCNCNFCWGNYVRTVDQFEWRFSIRFFRRYSECPKEIFQIFHPFPFYGVKFLLYDIQDCIDGHPDLPVRLGVLDWIVPMFDFQLVTKSFPLFSRKLEAILTDQDVWNFISRNDSRLDEFYHLELYGRCQSLCFNPLL